MTFDVLTIFPELIHFYLRESIMKRAMERELIDVRVVNIRDFTTDKHRSVDDAPYGGGAGMVMKIEPLYHALCTVALDGRKRRTILLSPEGEPFTQRKAEEFFACGLVLTLVCGRYEGVDERIKHFVDEEISIGDYILTGGELPALVMIDAISRLVPGVLGDERSKEEESFTTGLLDYPHYTRPAEFQGMAVPDVLLSGNHLLIQRWRRKEALKRTLAKRPALIAKNEQLTGNDLLLLHEIQGGLEQ